MCITARTGPGKNQEPRSPFGSASGSPSCAGGRVPSTPATPVHFQEAGLEAEEPGIEPGTAVWDIVIPSES